MKETEGDLISLFLLGKFDVIIHGCNCHNIMGAGIAKQIALRIPEAKYADDMFHMGAIAKLGNYSVATVRRDNGKMGFVINLYSQYNPGAELNKNALLTGFFKLSQVLYTDSKIGIPLIGCGIAGGNWDEISPEIAKIMSNHNVTVVKYKREKNVSSKINQN